MSEKKISTKSIVAKLEKRFGAGIITDLAGAPAENTNVFRTGSPGLDKALGGGLVRGRVAELYGYESSGKSTIAIHACKEAQAEGEVVAYIDAEHAFNLDFAKKIGLNMDINSFLFIQPDTGEDAFNIMQALLNDGVKMIVVDSVAALVTAQMASKDAGEATVGSVAKLMSEELNKIKGKVNKENACIIFINQVREKIGVMYGDPSTTPGGKALKFYASVRIEVKRKETIKDGDRPIGIRSKIKVVKNKIAPPYREAMINIFFDRGIDKVEELADLGFAAGVLVAKGTGGVLFEGAKIAPRKDAVGEVIRKDSALAKRLETAIQSVSEGAHPDTPEEATQDED